MPHDHVRKSHKNTKYRLYIFHVNTDMISYKYLKQACQTHTHKGSSQTKKNLLFMPQQYDD